MISFFIHVLSQPHFGLSVKMKPTLPTVRTWSPPRLPKPQSSSSAVKKPRIKLFFISLERSWSVDVQNGLAWAIWTSAAQVMFERRDGSQTGSLISRPLKVGNRLDPGVCRWSVKHRWKALEESYNFGLDLVPIWARGKKYESPKPRESKPGQFWDSTLGVPGKKKPFGCKCGGELQRILYGGRWWLPPSSGHGESSESKVVRGLSQHQKGAKWILNNLLVDFGCRTE